MNDIPLIEAAAAESRFGWVRQAENILLIVPLSAMMLLPVVEILLRSVFKTGMSGSSAARSFFRLKNGTAAYM